MQALNKFCYNSAIGRVQVRLKFGVIVYFGWLDSAKFGDKLIRFNPEKKNMLKPLALPESLQNHLFVSDHQNLFFAYKNDCQPPALK